jgi:hypothetical protein
MAHSDHVKLVESGPMKFPKWRKQNPKITLELDYEVLNNLLLKECNLNPASLYGSWIGYSALYEVAMIDIDFREGQVYLSGLHNCNLSKVRMTHSVLSLSLLKYCNLNKTDFTDSRFKLMTIAGCDLSKCVGLDTVSHLSSTSIDLDTLTKSFVGAGECFTQELRAFFINAGVNKKLLDLVPQIFED